MACPTPPKPKFQITNWRHGLFSVSAPFCTAIHDFSGILLLHGRFPSFNSGGSSAQNQNQNHTFEYSQYLLLNSIVNKFHNTTFEFVHLVWNTSLVVGQLSEFYPIENLHADRKRAIISYVANSKKWRRGIGTTQRLSGRL